MAAVDDPKTLGRARLSFASEADIDELAEVLAKFERGEISADQWRAFRLVRGTYGQRQNGDLSMLRAKIPQGVLTAEQLLALARVGEKYSRGFGHITTRQNMQFHFMKLGDVEPAMRELAAAGLTTREACGNSVRNITCCPYAGVSADEVFDVTPYAEALTRYLLRHPLSSSLPRKFKIAAEGCREDHVLTAINDLGIRAALHEGQRGFRITAGGGTAIKCQSGNLLHPFLPAGQLFEVAESLLRVFHRMGDREHRQRNRMKFLVAQLGWDAFRAEYEKARARVIAEGAPTLPFPPQAPPEEAAPSWVRPPAPAAEASAARATQTPVKGPGLVPDIQPALELDPEAHRRWRRFNLRPQKQPGFVMVVATVPLGDVTSSQLLVLADLCRSYGDGQVRVTTEQDLLLRWVREEDVEAVHRQLLAIGLGLPDAGTVSDVTSCPGAESCKLAVTQSRGLGKLLGDFLRARPELVAAAPDVKIKISGCPNGCGLHHVAGIGFQGSIRKVGAKVVPQYFVMLGGGVTSEGAGFGRIAAKIPARRIPEALERLLRLYQRQRHVEESGTGFFRRVELGEVKAMLADLEVMTPQSAVPDDYVDLGETQEFKPETTEGECAA
ncbi:MAG: nitrite/sulfite reductase [Myxococcota bacterium]